MSTPVDVAVVGAGIIGASIGHQLMAHGVERVMVLDKGAGPGEGSTGASSAICRCRYTHPEVVRLALHGRRAYAEWPAFTGLDNPRAGLHTTGMAWLMGETLKAARTTADRLAGQGVRVEVLAGKNLSKRFPALSPCDVPVDTAAAAGHECAPAEALVYEPDAGYVDPVGATQDLLEATSRMGGIVRFGTRVVNVTGGPAPSLDLADGERVSAGLVVNAAGPWANAINQMAGVVHRWTLTPTRVQIVQRAWPQDLEPIPIVADASTGIYFRPGSAGTVLVGSVREEDEQEEVSDPDAFKRSADPGFVEMKLAGLHHRVPGLAARGIPKGIAGAYTVNREDMHPIVGPSGVEGVWLANGFSGHGFKLAPAIGSMVASAITGNRLSTDTDVPMDFFSVGRQPVQLRSRTVLA